jgi:hypothetical protein
MTSPWPFYSIIVLMPSSNAYFKCKFKFSCVIVCHEVPVGLDLIGIMVLWSLTVSMCKEVRSTCTNTLGRFGHFLC